MPSDPREFPHEAVRDLLGIARAMYAVEAEKTRRADLAEIGTALRSALDIARRAPADSLGGRTALRRAEEATQRLCAVVEGDVLRLVHATAGRVRRG